MARKVRHEEHENHERWLVSYADFITLLFAFFTVLYATAQSDQEKLEALMDGMNAAFEGGLPDAFLTVLRADPFLPDTPPLSNLPVTQDAAVPIVHSIKRGLSGSLSDNAVQIGLFEQDLVLVMPERLLFAPGSAELHPSAFAVLGKVAEVVAQVPAHVEVVGHADAMPVTPGGPWEDNWALSSARALTAVRYLAKRGVPDERLAASAEYDREAGTEARAITIRIRAEEPAPSAEILNRLGIESEK